MLRNPTCQHFTFEMVLIPHLRHLSNVHPPLPCSSVSPPTNAEPLCGCGVALLAYLRDGIFGLHGPGWAPTVITQLGGRSRIIPQRLFSKPHADLGCFSLSALNVSVPLDGHRTRLAHIPSILWSPNGWRLFEWMPFHQPHSATHVDALEPLGRHTQLTRKHAHHGQPQDKSTALISSPQQGSRQVRHRTNYFMSKLVSSVHQYTVHK